MQAYKQEVQAIEDSLSSRAKSNLTPKELADVLRKLDDQFMSLAAQLYSLNEELSVGFSALTLYFSPQKHRFFDNTKI